jgi:hypothetical protein
MIPLEPKQMSENQKLNFASVGNAMDAANPTQRIRSFFDIARDFSIDAALDFEGEWTEAYCMSGRISNEANGQTILPSDAELVAVPNMPGKNKLMIKIRRIGDNPIEGEFCSNPYETAEEGKWSEEEAELINSCAHVMAESQMLYEGTTMPDLPAFNEKIWIREEPGANGAIYWMSTTGIDPSSMLAQLASGGQGVGLAGLFAGLSSINVGDPKPGLPTFVEPPEDTIEKVYLAFGKPIGTTKQGAVKNFSVRFMAVRYPVNAGNVNHFRDILFAAVRENDKWNYYPFSITTSPGAHFLGDVTYSRGGTANMASPQLSEGVYKEGQHRGKYTALVQGGNTWYWVDNNRNTLPDILKSTPTMSKPANVKLWFAQTGLNMHRASAKNTSSRISGGSGNVSSDPDKKTVYYLDEAGNLVGVKLDLYTWSAGCQVFASPDSFAKMLQLVARDKVTNGTTSWDYIVLDKSQYDKFANELPLFELSKELKATMVNYQTILNSQ